MLSVAKLTLGQEAYYEQQVARGLDDYYAGRGESPGIWAASGSGALGLVGVVEDGELGMLLRGVNPANAERLRSAVRERTITVRTLDVDSGEWREEQKRLAPVSGYDLVFSCPKSVSVLHALTDDERVRQEISEAHEASWLAALAYLEREACIVRRGHGGAIREHGQGFVAAAFRHRTSRAQDPHLHTHVIIANLTGTEDGEWRALDGDAILRTYRLAAGYLYEAHLRNELTLRLGLKWTQPVKGMAELVGVPEEAIRCFSTRRLSLLEHMEALGTEGFAAARVAALVTREAKEQIDLPRLREDWKARAAEHGLGRRDLEALVHDRSLDHERVELDRLAAVLLGRDGLTEKQTTFTMPELVRAVATVLPAGGSANEVLEVADELASVPGVELVDEGDTPGRPARFTTRELLEVEREAVELALAGRNVTTVPRPERRPLAEALMLTGHDLSGEQRMFVHEAACRSDRVVCVVGVAGSGKTAAMRAFADAFRGSDATVLGAAPSGRAADELQTATGIPSRTLHRLLLDAHRDDGLPHRCVLVVDEAGMAGTRVLAPLLDAVEQAEGKLLLVGDPAQLPAVGAGGLYQALCDHLDTIELTGNRRQRDPLEREALAHLRAGDPGPYLAYVAPRGRLAVDDNPMTAKQRLLADWWRAGRRNPTLSVMLAYRRDDVDELNQAAHALMLRNRRLGDHAVTVGAREFRIRDKVLCRRNDDRLGLRNGMRATVVDVEDDALIIRDQTRSVRRVPFDYATEHLDYGYALTGHAAQGLTVDRAYVLLQDRGTLQEWGYVACSRARLETRLYLADRDALERETLLELDPDAPPDRAVRALQRSSVDPLALDQRRTRADTIVNYLAQQQGELDRYRERTTDRLEAVERERAGLHWWNRDHRAELVNEVAIGRASLERLDQRREQLDRRSELRSQSLALAQERDELAPSKQPKPPRPSLAIKLEREPRGLGLEL